MVKKPGKLKQFRENLFHLGVIVIFGSLVLGQAIFFGIALELAGHHADLRAAKHEVANVNLHLLGAAAVVVVVSVFTHGIFS